MTSSPTTPSTPLSDAQIAEIFSLMEQLVRLVAPLTALLAGASGMAGGAGQRLEELIQQLTSISTGMNLNVDDLTQVFGPTGALMQMEQRMVEMEAAMQKSVMLQAQTVEHLRQISGWMKGAA